MIRYYNKDTRLFHNLHPFLFKIVNLWQRITKSTFPHNHSQLATHSSNQFNKARNVNQLLTKWWNLLSFRGQKKKEKKKETSQPKFFLSQKANLYSNQCPINQLTVPNQLADASLSELNLFPLTMQRFLDIKTKEKESNYTSIFKERWICRKISTNSIPHHLLQVR